MIKPLIKKQLLELKYMFFKDRKTGAMISGKKMIGSIMLMGFVLISCSLSFGMISELIAISILPLNMDYLYFAIIGMMAVMLGTFVCMFTASSSIYNAKDNEMMLSMPIKPFDLLISRMLELYLLALAYGGWAWLPCIVVYTINKGFVFVVIFRALIGWCLIGLLILVLSMVFGYIVTIFGRLFKNKSYITILISVLLLGGYYYLNANMNNYISQLAAHIDETINFFDSYLLLSVIFGKGIAQSWGWLFVFVLIIAIALGVVVYIAQRSFIRIATMGSITKKAVYNNKVNEKNSVMVALIKREWHHFINNPTYALNTGLGIVFLVAGCIVAVVMRNDLAEMAEAIKSTEGICDLLPLGIIALTTSVFSMDALATPAVSLEGKTYWQIRSLPVDSRSVLKAKTMLQILLNGIPYVLCNIILSFVMHIEGSVQVYMIMMSIFITFFIADCDLISGILGAKLKWTNEAMVIKQSGNVLISLLSGWAVSFIPCILYFFVQAFIDVGTYMMVWIVLFALGYRLMEKWIGDKGVKKFENLD